MAPSELAVSAEPSGPPGPSERGGSARRHAEVASRFTAAVDGTTSWAAPTPVDGWVASDVVDHLVSWLRGFLAGSGVDLGPVPPVADDPVAAWHAHADAVQALLDDPASDAREFSNPHTGSMPLPVAIDRFYTTDVFLHTWDLARATGQDDRLGDDTCADLLEAMEPMDGLLRASGQYGPRVDVADDADAQARLLAFIGRDPGWTPA